MSHLRFEFCAGLARRSREARPRTPCLSVRALPIGVREFIKTFGWAVAFNDGGIERLKERLNEEDRETAKRTVVFAYWTRALSYGVPENDFEQFMEAYFAFVDAKVAGDETEMETAMAAIKRWEKYAG